MKQNPVVCGKEYRIIRLLGHGKGGYSYLAERDGRQVVLKQIHHEPCDEGPVIFDLIRDGIPADPYIAQVREMAALAEAAGLNIDYFPTNFVVRDGLIWYIDYECNGYMDEWNFENWGIQYWSRTPAFKKYLKEHGQHG